MPKLVKKTPKAPSGPRKPLATIANGHAPAREYIATLTGPRRQYAEARLHYILTYGAPKVTTTLPKSETADVDAMLYTFFETDS